MITITKLFSDYPFAHRQPNHAGHCRLIHGHNWSFEVTFAANTLDSNGFVADFGKMQGVKQWLTEHFDHTLVLNHNDPLILHLQDVLGPVSGDSGATGGDLPALAKIVTVPNCGAEGLAEFVGRRINHQLPLMFVDCYARALHVVRVTAYEDSKNSATWELGKGEAPR